MATPLKPEQTPLNVEKGEAQVGHPQSPLNVEKGERQVSELEVAQSPSEEKSPADEMKEKLKKPTIGATLVIFLIINSIQFFTGITTTKDCPVRSIIPIYLAVAGALGIVTKVVPIINSKRRIKIIDKILGGLVLIELIWMVLGSYWIYSIYEPNYNPFEHPNDYCNKTTYLLAFWLLTLNYICMVLAIAIPCCIICGFCCCAALCAGMISSSE